MGNNNSSSKKMSAAEYEAFHRMSAADDSGLSSFRQSSSKDNTSTSYFASNRVLPLEGGSGLDSERGSTSGMSFSQDESSSGRASVSEKLSVTASSSDKGLSPKKGLPETPKRETCTEKGSVPQRATAVDDRESVFERGAVSKRRQAVTTKPSKVIKPENQQSNSQDPGYVDLGDVPVKHFSGGVVVGCSSRDDASKMKELADAAQSDHKKVMEVPESHHPRIIIAGLSTRHDPDTLVELFKAQNSNIICNPAVIECVNVNPMRSDNEDRFQAIVQVDAVTYSMALDKPHVFIGCDICKVFDAMRWLKDMNQPSGLLERFSPRPMVCPLVRLGHNSSSTDDTVTSNENNYEEEHEYNFSTQYVDSYDQNTSDRQFHNKQLSIDNSYLQKQSNDSSFLQQYYHEPHSFLNEEQEYAIRYESNSRNSPSIKNNLFGKQNMLDLSSLSISETYWKTEDYGKIMTNQSKINPDEYYRCAPQTQEQYHLDDFSKLGKSSPCLDQGYHTLVSPSPGNATPNLWIDGNLYKGKKYQVKNNSFDRLSDELVTKVFSYLTSYDLSICARVCRRFDVLVWNSTLWRTIIIDGDHISGDKAIRGILRQLCGQGRTGTCPSVEKIYVTNGAKLSDKSLMLLARRCPELIHIQTQGCTSITNNAIMEVATRCGNLQHLDVTGCLKISCITANSMHEPPRKLQLQYLDLTDCLALQDTGLRIIVHNCPQLAYLYLRRCVQITDAGLKFVPSFCLGLRELSVSDCSNVTDFGLYELAKLGATLRYLSVAKCDQVSDAGLKVIARRCYKLRYLNARGCEAVSDDAITVLARFCTRLRALDIGKCDVSDAGLRALAESCPNLKKLSLRNCDLVTDRGVQCIAYYCRGLQQLNIQDCQISLEGYRAVKKYCKRCVIEHTNPGFF